MLSRALAQIRCYPRRLVALTLAIVLGVGFTAAAVVFSGTVEASLAADVGAQSLKADVIASENDHLAAAFKTVASTAGVRHAEILYSGSTRFSSAKSKGSMQLDMIPSDPALRWYGIAAGRWPNGAHEILIDAATAKRDNLAIGNAVKLSGWDGDTSAAVTVTGIADTGSSSLSGGGDQLYANAGLFNTLQLDSYGEIAVLGKPGVTPDALRDNLSAALGPDVNVATGAQDAAAKAKTDTGFGVVLIGFAVIAMVVAAIVIANTFTILLTQRRRELAVLRCVGASGRQIRDEVLLEGAVLGVAGSAVGIGVGIGVAALAASITDLDRGGMRLDLPMLLGVFGVGVLVTTLAAALPAARAARVAPLAALRPAAGAVDEAELSTSSRLRWLVGGLLTLVGAAALLYGANTASLMIALVGGAVSAIGVLMLTRSVLPLVIGGLALLARSGGAPAAMAAANVRRNPGRSAGTSAALLVGVGLIVTLQVGAASARATMDGLLAERYPVDVGIADVSGKPLPRSVIDAAAAAGLDPAPVAGAMATLGVPSPDGTKQTLVLAPSAKALTDARGGAGGLTDAAVIVPKWWTDQGVPAGSTLTITIDGKSKAFTVTPGHLADAGGSSSVVISSAALAALSPTAGTVATWAMLPAAADAGAVNSALQQATASHSSIQVTGTAEERASTDGTLSTMLTLATALLAVAVVIAVVGIGNTLGLSVLERTRESALLRALGLQRRQLRGMVAVEALLLAAVGAIVGIALGVGYGVAGARAAVGEAGRSAVIELPWGQIGVVLALSLTAGLLASVLPARRAARVQPAAALAEVG